MYLLMFSSHFHDYFPTVYNNNSLNSTNINYYSDYIDYNNIVYRCILSPHSILFIDAKAHLNSNKRGSDVEAGVQGVGDPLLVDLHQLPDAPQQFSFIKQLPRKKTRGLTPCMQAVL